jgi:hypothetical protein
MTANLMRIEALAAEFTFANDGHRERFERWGRQLAALERETERLWKSMAGIADTQEALATAAVLEKGIADTLRSPPGERNKIEPFVPVRERCRDALATVSDRLGRVREAQESLAAARDADWGILKTAPGYVGSLCSELSALEQTLHDTRARIEAIHNRFKTDRPRLR